MRYLCVLTSMTRASPYQDRISMDSEDLTATLTAENDSLYVLKQVEGSTLKVPKEGKWQKLPSKLVLKRRNH